MRIISSWGSTVIFAVLMSMAYGAIEWEPEWESMVPQLYVESNGSAAYDEFKELISIAARRSEPSIHRYRDQLYPLFRKSLQNAKFLGDTHAQAMTQQAARVAALENVNKEIEASKLKLRDAYFRYEAEKKAIEVENSKRPLIYRAWGFFSSLIVEREALPSPANVEYDQASDELGSKFTKFSNMRSYNQREAQKDEKNRVYYYKRCREMINEIDQLKENLQLALDAALATDSLKKFEAAAEAAERRRQTEEEMKLLWERTQAGHRKNASAMSHLLYPESSYEPGGVYNHSEYEEIRAPATIAPAGSVLRKVAAVGALGGVGYGVHSLLGAKAEKPKRSLSVKKVILGTVGTGALMAGGKMWMDEQKKKKAKVTVVKPEEKKGLSTGAIVGIVIGSCVGLGLIVGLIVYLKRKEKFSFVF